MSDSPRRHPNVVNVDELTPQTVERGHHHVTFLRPSGAAGGKQLGVSILEVPPGKISYPFHYHCANEEALYILAGTGIARIGDARVPVRAGDYVAYPVGPAHAHQLINDGDVPLRYLAMSTQHMTEVVGYPDSNKVGIRAGDSYEHVWLRQIVKGGESLGYWDDEPEA